jgi:hypothetical protein
MAKKFVSFLSASLLLGTWLTHSSAYNFTSLVNCSVKELFLDMRNTPVVGTWLNILVVWLHLLQKQ